MKFEKDDKPDIGSRLDGALWESSTSFPFEVKAPLLAVLDKSFLDGVNAAQLQYYAQRGWFFAIPEVLMYEHFRKRDRRRIANLFKLHAVERSLVLLPGIGEMFRSEATTLRPACMTMRAKPIRFTVEQGPSGEYFELDHSSRMSTERRSRDLKKKCLTMMSVWHSLRQIPDLREASPKETPEVIQGLSLKIRNDREDIRGFYANHRQSWFPAPDLLDEKWAFFRWIQVYLLAGLDYISRYGVQTNPNEESMAHELLDLDYLISALLVGGLACREYRFLERFRFLRGSGLILK